MVRWWRSRDREVPVERAAPEPTATPAVTRERIAAWFTDQGYVFFTDALNELGGLWRSNIFSFLLIGSGGHVLQVRGQWHRQVTIDRIDEILELCNAWNTTRVWPKCYVKVRDDGMIDVVGEVSSEVAEGADDAQLGTHLLSGISAASLFFAHLEAHYPDPATTAPGTGA